MNQAVEPISETHLSPTAQFADFWRRVGAFLVDSIVQGFLAIPLGFLIGERLAPIGSPTRLLGLLIILPYLGILGSRIGGGQTPGKRLLGLRVVDAQGQPLPLSRSFARAALLWLPSLVNNLQFASLSPVVMAIAWLALVVSLGVGGATIGTFLFNRPTRQTLHDLVVGSYVVHADRLGLSVPARSTWRPLVGSAAWVGLAAVVTTMLLMKARGINSQFPPALIQSMSAMPGVTSYELESLPTGGADRSSNVISVVIWFNGAPEDTEKAAMDVAAAILQSYPGATTVEKLIVRAIRGWDLGLFHMTSSKTFVQTPAQWRAELGP
jgi:uncharacterized RDD family membrane protein YckC